MKRYNVGEDELASVANAIRTKTGRNQPMAFPNGFISEIGAIPTGGTNLVTKTITSNGIFNPAADNADGYSMLTVSVPTSSTPLEKLYTYTVTTPWEGTFYARHALEETMEGYISSNALEYLFVFTNNSSTSTYRTEAMCVYSTAATMSELLDGNNTTVFMWRNYYQARATGLDTTVRAASGTRIDIYRAMRP